MYDLDRVLEHCREAVGFLDGCTLSPHLKYVQPEAAQLSIARARKVLLTPGLTHRQDFSQGTGPIVEARCSYRSWLQNLGHVPCVYLVADDALSALQSSLVGVQHEAREQVAGVDPTRPGVPLHCLQQWRRSGRQHESVSHYDVTLWAMEIRKPDWIQQYRLWERGSRVNPRPPLPRFGSDPVFTFLQVYAIKQGPPGTKAPWILREAARR